MRNKPDVPPSQKALHGLVLAAENAQRHLRCAQILSDAGEHGVGVSHLVLAGEEAIKAMAYLSIVTHRWWFPKTFIARFLNVHKARHEIGEYMAVIWGLITEVLTRILIVEERFAQDTEEYEHERTRVLVEYAEELLRKTGSDPRADSFPDEVGWWRRANDEKNRGLYVDFADGTWATPAEVTQREFEAGVRLIKPLVNAVTATAEDWAGYSPDRRRREMRRLFRQFRGSKARKK